MTKGFKIYDDKGNGLFYSTLSSANRDRNLYSNKKIFVIRELELSEPEIEGLLKLEQRKNESTM